MIVIKIRHKLGGMAVPRSLGVTDLALLPYPCDPRLETIFGGSCKTTRVCGLNSFTESSVHKNGHASLSVALCVIARGTWKIF